MADFSIASAKVLLFFDMAKFLDDFFEIRVLEQFYRKMERIEIQCDTNRIPKQAVLGFKTGHFEERNRLFWTSKQAILKLKTGHFAFRTIFVRMTEKG